jgi:hypothetical protein
MNRYSSPISAFIPDDYVDDSTTQSSSPSSITSFVPDVDRDNSPESDFSPIIDFTNEDVDGSPTLESPVGAFLPDENVDSSPNSDSSDNWGWPENQLGLQRDNLDSDGEIKHHEATAKY